MANKRAAQGRKPLNKEQIREINRRKAEKNRRAMLAQSHNAAVYNSRERAMYNSNRGKNGGRSAYDDYGDYQDFSPAANDRSNQYNLPEVDRQFAADIQKMKFCRKPVGFLMSLIFLISLALIALPFIPLDNDLVNKVGNLTAVFAETEAKQAADPGNQTDEENKGEEDKKEDEGEKADNAAEDGEGESAGEENKGETADGAEEGAEEGGEGASGGSGSGSFLDSLLPEGSYYKLSDPVYGWISYIAKLFKMDISLGDSPWYDSQISKVETGMDDKIAAILIQAFPAAILLYAIFALVLFIKTFICWASGDRRIYRHTGIECLIMIILAAVVLLGGLATTVDIDGKLEFGGIVNFLIGLVMGKGGFTAGYGMLLMLVMPVIGLILSFFLLEKKLRSREITQPIIMYQYKDTYRKAKARAERR